VLADRPCRVIIDSSPVAEAAAVAERPA